MSAGVPIPASMSSLRRNGLNGTPYCNVLVASAAASLFSYSRSLRDRSKLQKSPRHTSAGVPTDLLLSTLRACLEDHDVMKKVVTGGANEDVIASDA
jgi:hypothetical protein